MHSELTKLGTIEASRRPRWSNGDLAHSELTKLGTIEASACARRWARTVWHSELTKLGTIEAFRAMYEQAVKAGIPS